MCSQLLSFKKQSNFSFHGVFIIISVNAKKKILVLVLCFCYFNNKCINFTNFNMLILALNKDNTDLETISCEMNVINKGFFA